MDVWKIAFDKVEEIPSIPENWHEMFEQWKQKFPWELNAILVITRSWMAL